MRKMAAVDILVITISHNISFVGKAWWVLTVGLRLVVILLAGFSLFSDEQERFICNTIQPGCSNVCFDLFAPLSLLRLWLLQLVLLCLPHVIFGTYVTHKVLSTHGFGASYCHRSEGGSCSTRKTSSSSRETSLHKPPLRDLLPAEWQTPTFHCAYFLVVIMRILLEVFFAAGQFLLFGLSVPRSFLCYEAPCFSGVQCYTSRPTEKTLMLNFMLGVAALSVLLSAVDLVTSVKTMVRRRRKRDRLVEEMSRGEQSSVFTSTSGGEDTDVLLTKRAVAGGHLKKNDVRNGKVPTDGVPYDVTCDVAAQAKSNGGTDINKAINGRRRSSECRDAKAEVPRSPPATGTPVPSHFVLHSHLKPPLSPRQDTPTPGGPRRGGQDAPGGTGSGHQSDSSEARDRRAWV